jgi:hypothetical protein
MAEVSATSIAGSILVGALDAGSCPNGCSGSWNAGRRHTLPLGLEDQDTFGLPAGLAQPA